MQRCLDRQPREQPREEAVEHFLGVFPSANRGRVQDQQRPGSGGEQVVKSVDPLQPRGAGGSRERVNVGSWIAEVRTDERAESAMIAGLDTGARLCTKSPVRNLTHRSTRTFWSHSGVFSRPDRPI